MQSQDKIAVDELSDAVLAAQVARGESCALETLYDRYASIVLGISLKILEDQAAAEDVLQETFWHVWRSAATYQSQRGSFTGWLFRIARNLAIDAYRRRRIRPRPITDVDASDTKLDGISDSKMDVVEQSQLLLMHKQVAGVLASLPVEQRQVIEMAFFYGMTRQEIAESTGEALGTIHTARAWRYRNYAHSCRVENSKIRNEWGPGIFKMKKYWAIRHKLVTLIDEPVSGTIEARVKIEVSR